jgi:GNAT superfamily N-acetyltransferase
MFIMKLLAEEAGEVDPSLEIKELRRSDIDRMLKVMYLSCADIYNRFDRGERCFAVMDGEEIAAYIWEQFDIKRMEELLLDFKLRPNQAWFYNAVTLKHARGRGYYQNIMRYTTKVMKEEGFDELFGFAEERNRASIRGLEKAGYKIVVKVQMKKLLSRVRYKMTVFNKTAWRQLSPTIEYFYRVKNIVEEDACL